VLNFGHLCIITVNKFQRSVARLSRHIWDVEVGSPNLAALTKLIFKIESSNPAFHGLCPAHPINIKKISILLKSIHRQLKGVFPLVTGILYKYWTITFKKNLFLTCFNA